MSLSSGENRKRRWWSDPELSRISSCEYELSSEADFSGAGSSEDSWSRSYADLSATTSDTESYHLDSSYSDSFSDYFYYYEHNPRCDISATTSGSSDSWTEDDILHLPKIGRLAKGGMTRLSLDGENVAPKIMKSSGKIPTPTVIAQSPSPPAPPEISEEVCPRFEPKSGGSSATTTTVVTGSTTTTTVVTVTDVEPEVVISPVPRSTPDLRVDFFAEVDAGQDDDEGAGGGGARGDLKGPLHPPVEMGCGINPTGVRQQPVLPDVVNLLTPQELHDFEMKYGSPHHSRSQSVKTVKRPNYLSLPQQRSRVASMPNTGNEEEYYRLRHFSITGKGVINRGDSLKSRRSRSNNSVASSNSSHSTEHLGGVSSYPGSARTSGDASLASSRESSTSGQGSLPFRVVMLGAAGVGKSSLINQFMTSEYLHAYDTSLDDEFGEKNVSVLLNGEESELIFIDHPSAEMSPENCISTYEPQAYVVVYSIADRASLLCAEETLQYLWKSDSFSTKAVILVGNKTDLVRSRAVTTEEGKQLATSYESKFIETSVAINHNVDELLVGILSQIRLKTENPERTRDLFRKRSSRKRYRGSRTTASLKVKGLLEKVWNRDSKSKSCENLHVL